MIFMQKISWGTTRQMFSITFPGDPVNDHDEKYIIRSREKLKNEHDKEILKIAIR